MITRHYADSRFGQIHLRLRNGGESNVSKVLVLLHPMPYSSLYFTTFMPLVEKSYTVVAVDYPGCGQSDAMTAEVSIAHYAEAVIDVLADLKLSGPCDFLGFHTGCLVAAEIARTSPGLVRSTVLIDVPYFDQAKRQTLLCGLASHKQLTEELECLQQHWNNDVKPRLGSMPLERAFALFVDHIGAAGDGADGFHAAFSYAGEQSLTSISQPTLVIATDSSLHDATLTAAALISECRLCELTQVKRAVFEEGAATIADTVNDWLA